MNDYLHRDAKTLIFAEGIFNLANGTFAPGGTKMQKVQGCFS